MISETTETIEWNEEVNSRYENRIQYRKTYLKKSQSKSGGMRNSVS